MNETPNTCDLNVEQMNIVVENCVCVIVENEMSPV